MTAPSNQPRAAIRHENGQQPYTDAEIDAGHVLAGVEPPEPSPGFVRSLYHHRRRYRHLADHGTWWVATVTEISRGHDLTGVTVGVPFRWIVTATSVELYNLAEDSGEKNDLATKHPELVRKLRAHLEAQSAKDNDAVPN